MISPAYAVQLISLHFLDAIVTFLLESSPDSL